MDENKIIPYIEPIFRFCCNRISNRYDAEDLTSEIICHILDGVTKYNIKSFDAWVWRIAHNRYARFVDAQSKSREILSDKDLAFEVTDYSEVDEESTVQKYETVFRYLHTLSSEYRNIFVDYYLEDLPVKKLAQKYSLPETTIKWRLNVGRKKIRDRIGENKMEKIYQRINWNTTTCNGNMDPDAYLHTQISRAICLAAYEKPLTVEEISIKTGIPTIYIEDELPRLEYGDAIRKIGNKYATDFIIFSLENRKQTEGVTDSIVKGISDRIEKLLYGKNTSIETMDFYGHDFGMERLGYIVIPYLLRHKIRHIMHHRLKLESKPYPPRTDGGYGWYLVEETVDEAENVAEYSSGCNIAGDDSGSKPELLAHIYYYWIGKFFDNEIYHNGGMRWMCANGIVQNSKDGIIERHVLTDEDAVRLIQKNLITKCDGGYQLQFACFTATQFAEFINLFDLNDDKIEDLLAEWILTVHKNFKRFVPARLHDQINQWIDCYLNQIVGYVVDELIRRGSLRIPDPEKPLVDSVFYVEGEYIHP